MVRPPQRASARDRRGGVSHTGKVSSFENRHLWSCKSLRIETLSYRQSKNAQAPSLAANEGRLRSFRSVARFLQGRAIHITAHFHLFVVPLAAAWVAPLHVMEREAERVR